MVALNIFMLAAGTAVIVWFFRTGRHRLQRTVPWQADLHALLPVAALALFLAYLVLGRAGVSVAAWWFAIDLEPLRQGGTLSMQDQARLALGMYLGQSLILIALATLHIVAKRAGDESQPSHGRAAALGAIAFLLSWPVVASSAMLAGLVLWWLTGQPVETVAHETLRLFIEETPDLWYFVMVALALLAAPIMEEVAYRGLMQGALVQANLGRWPAIVATSAIFALMHGGIAQPHAIPALFTLSLALGWVYERTGRLTAPIVMHALFNAANLGLALLTR